MIRANLRIGPSKPWQPPWTFYPQIVYGAFLALRKTENLRNVMLRDLSTSLAVHLTSRKERKMGKGKVCVFVNSSHTRADFREGDEDSNFSVFRVRRFTESPGPLHWIAFPVEILTKPPIHWIASPLFTEKPRFFYWKSASSHPLPKNQLWRGTEPNLSAPPIADRYRSTIAPSFLVSDRHFKKSIVITDFGFSDHRLIGLWFSTYKLQLIARSRFLRSRSCAKSALFHTFGRSFWNLGISVQKLPLWADFSFLNILPIHRLADLYPIFCAVLCQKCAFPHFWALFLELAEAPRTFVQIDVLAVWALWLEVKCTRQGAHHFPMRFLHSNRFPRGITLTAVIVL